MDLEQQFLNVSQSTERVVEKIRLYDHPLLTLLRTESQKQHDMLLSLLHVFQQEGEHLPSLESFKEYCSVAYHANELAHSFFESWTRAADWMKLPSKAIVPDVKSEMSQIKNSMNKAAKEMENIYGYEAVKYVIPTFYLPASS